MIMMAETISITVEGKVQGVFYRQSTKEKATELNITGMVRNLPDGKVFILATGETDNLNALVAWCWVGSRRATVTNVIVSEKVFQPFAAFSIEK